MNTIDTQKNIDLMSAEIIDAGEFELVSSDEYTIVPQQPILGQPFESEGETLLRTEYHGRGMNPILKSGDSVLLKKWNKMSYFSGEIYMIQLIDGETVFCRPQKSEKEGCIFATFDNPDYLRGRSGFDIKEKYIVAYWELIASQRIHSFSYATMRIPIFRKTNINH